jgi:hypothetical protein
MVPRCHLCRARGDIEELHLAGGLWWCAEGPECKHRARLRLHFDRDESEDLLRAERLGVHVSEIARPPEPIEAPRLRPVAHRFCRKHSSHFCPCASPHLYRDDPEGAAKWQQRRSRPRRARPDVPVPAPAAEQLSLWRAT